MSRQLYLGLMALVVLQRLGELARAKRNLRWLQARGGVEVGAGHYPWMVALHAAFLASCPLEVWFLARPFIPLLGLSMLALLAVATGLRYWAIASLGRRWTTRVVALPGEPRVVEGPYRLLDHPNYLAVILEVAALPLVHTAWITALVFSGLNLLLLRTRVRVEEAALKGVSPEGGR